MVDAVLNHGHVLLRALADTSSRFGLRAAMATAFFAQCEACYTLRNPVPLFFWAGN